ncbi:MAG: DUF1214 domain-containing protein [Spirochaetales bacterium]|nr:DUF1214 domain-containing protein [Spirochaetales bacterium]
MAILRLRGATAEDEAARRILSGRSWAEFCDTLKAAGSAIAAPAAPRDALNQAEGYRYLSRLVRAGLEAFVEYADPKAPVLRRMIHETAKIGADNPDNCYLNAAISGQYEYRLRGTRGTVHFLDFSTQSGNYGNGGGLPLTGRLDSTELDVRKDGSFEVRVSCGRKPGNWLRMTPATSMLIVRQTFLDKRRETPCELSIERVGGDGLPTPLSCERLEQGLRMTANMVVGVPFLFGRWVRGFRRHTNQLPRMKPETSTAAGGDPDIAYYHSYWALDPEQALVIDFTPPSCEYWNFQLDNHWMESLDYRHYTIHVNKHTASYAEDGSVRIIVAHRDPGLPNWITTAGHSCGTMCLRWVKADACPEPRTAVVGFSNLEAGKHGDVGR